MARLHPSILIDGDLIGCGIASTPPTDSRNLFADAVKTTKGHVPRGRVWLRHFEQVAQPVVQQVLQLISLWTVTDGQVA